MPTRTAKSVLLPSLGAIVCDWIEEYLVHGPGDVQGKPIELDDEFRAFIWRCYELYPKGHPREGRRVHRRAFLSRPKGRAKSELAGELVCVEGLAPIRFDGWDRRGNPIGRPPTSPLVRCFATEEGQAGNTFDNAYYMLQNGSVYDEYPGLDIGLTRINLPDGGQIVALTSAAGSKDGGKDTFNVFDETHLWTTENLRKLFATVTRNLMKRMLSDGWALETSTMYSAGEDSVAEQTHSSSKTTAGVLFDHREAPSDVDIDDNASLLAALTYVYGPAAAWMDLEGIIESEFRDPQKRESDNRRYWLNQPASREEKWLTPAEWNPCADREREIADGEDVVLGFDGSQNVGRDMTALVVATCGPNPHLAVVKLWWREEGFPASWVVSAHEVEEEIRRACERWNVREIVADPWGWRHSLEALEAEGLPVVEFPQKPERMVPATTAFAEAVRTKTLTHSGDPTFAQHVFNCVLKLETRGGRIVKETQKSPKKIDLAIAGLIAYDRAVSIVPDTELWIAVDNWR